MRSSIDPELTKLCGGPRPGNQKAICPGTHWTSGRTHRLCFLLGVYGWSLLSMIADSNGISPIALNAASARRSGGRASHSRQCQQPSWSAQPPDDEAKYRRAPLRRHAGMLFVTATAMPAKSRATVTAGHRSPRWLRRCANTRRNAIANDMQLHGPGAKAVCRTDPANDPELPHRLAAGDRALQLVRCGLPRPLGGQRDLFSSDGAGFLAAGTLRGSNETRYPTIASQ